MQVNCPNCGEKVPADHINIQKMTAVCPACDTIFSFDLPEAETKAKQLVKSIYPVGIKVVGPDTSHPNLIGDLKIIGPDVTHPNFIYWDKESSSFPQ